MAFIWRSIHVDLDHRSRGKLGLSFGGRATILQGCSGAWRNGSAVDF